MRLLVCIAYHHTPERMQYLKSVLMNFIEHYKLHIDIIIDTNEGSEAISPVPNIGIIVHTHLEHPFHLTSMHRQHIKNNIDRYDYFMYVEDDILVPYESFLNYIENFAILWPKYVPGFVRIEEADGQQYVSDVVKPQELIIINKGGKQFTHLKYPGDYHGFWIMPEKELKESMTADFTKLSDGREFNAMYPSWGLQKPALVEIDNGAVSTKCYSYHLPNNYAQSKDSIQARFKPSEILL